MRNLIVSFCMVALNIASVDTVAQKPGEILDSNRARAVALWEEVISAKGGRERLHAVENLLIVSRVSVEAPRRLGPGETRKFYVLPDRAWLRASSLQPDVVVEATVVSIEGNLCRVTFSPKQAIPLGLSPCSFTKWGTHLTQDPVISLLETKWLQPKILRTRTEGSLNNQVHVIEAELNGLRMDFYIDRKTQLPFKLVINKPDGALHLPTQGAVTIKLSDYKSVDGIQMPGLITRESAARPTMATREVEYAKYSFNIEYDKSLFE